MFKNNYPFILLKLPLCEIMWEKGIMGSFFIFNK